MARPRSLSESKQHEICAMLACGCTFEAAARYACCNVVTIRREARRNPDFHERLRQATIQAQVTPVNVLHDAASSDWRAAAWLLERTDPGRFAKRSAKTFTEAEVADLLGRLYDIVRREVPSKERRLRIKRQLSALAKATLQPATKPRLPNLQPAPKPLPTNRDAAATSNSPAPQNESQTSTPPAPNREPAQPAPANSPAKVDPSKTAPAHAAVQNQTKPHPNLIRASDIPLGNSSTFAAADAT